MIINQNSRALVDAGGWESLAERERLVASAVRELVKEIDFDDPHDRDGEIGAAIVYEMVTGSSSTRTCKDISEALRLGLVDLT